MNSTLRTTDRATAFWRGCACAWLTACALFASGLWTFGANYPAPHEADFVISNFVFQSGQVLPELRIRYRTLGSPRRDEHGVVRNAVLIMHGTTGSGGQFIRPEFAGELFGPGQ